MARAASKYQAELRQGTHPGDAWNTASVDFVEAAKVLIGSLNEGTHTVFLCAGHSRGILALPKACQKKLSV